MERIIRIGGRDVLAGRDLTEGEYLRVQWPDGHEEVVKVFLVTETRTLHEHGHLDPTTFTVSKVCAHVEYHGAKVRVHLRRVRGLLAERVERVERVSAN